MSAEIEKKLWERINRYIPYLQVLPFVRMVAVCNNLSFGKVDDESDIDLFIVCKEGRLFTTRLLITLILHVLGVRRHRDKVKARFCLSFFIDDSHLDLSAIAFENDYYLAMWIRYLIPVVDYKSDGIGWASRFLDHNLWISDYFSEDLKGYSKDYLLRDAPLFKFFRFVLGGFFGFIWGNAFEWILKRWQLRRASKKALKADERASLIISDNILKFHNIDRRNEYNLKWMEAFGRKKALSKEEFLTIMD